MVGNFLQSITRAIPQAIPMIDPNTGLPVSGPVLNGQPSAPRNFDEAFAPFMNPPAAGPADLLEGTPYSADAMTAPAPVSQQPQAPQAPGQPPRQRRSLLETIGGVADVLARVGGAEALYQPTLDAREDRQRSIDLDEMRQTLLEQQISAGEQAPEEMMRGRIAQALGAVALNPEMASMWPQIAQEAGIDPQRAEAIGQIIQNNPAAAGVLAQSLGFEQPRQGSRPKEEAIYGMLLQEGGPELAKTYLQQLANPDSLSPYQAAMLELSLARLNLDEYKFERTEARAEEEAARGPAAKGPSRAQVAESAAPVVAGLRDAVQRLYQSGGMTDENSGVMDVAEAVARENIPGFERFTNSQGFSAREDLDRLLTVSIPSLLPLMGGLTIGGKNIDAAKELETWRKAIASAKDYPSAIRAIEGFENRIAELSKPEPAPRRSAPAPRRQSSSTARPAQRRSLSPAAAEARRRGLID